MKGTSLSHQEIVRTLLDSKAVNFEAIGAAVAKYGPALAAADEPWEGFCGTMRHFIRCYVVFGPTGNPVEQLGQLQNVAGEMKR